MQIWISRYALHVFSAALDSNTQDDLDPILNCIEKVLEIKYIKITKFSTHCKFYMRYFQFRMNLFQANLNTGYFITQTLKKSYCLVHPCLVKSCSAALLMNNFDFCCLYSEFNKQGTTQLPQIYYKKQNEFNLYGQISSICSDPRVDSDGYLEVFLPQSETPVLNGTTNSVSDQSKKKWCSNNRFNLCSVLISVVILVIVVVGMVIFIEKQDNKGNGLKKSETI